MTKPRKSRSGLGSGNAAALALAGFPELTSILAMACAAVVDAYDINLKLKSELVANMERAAVIAMVDVYTPAAATARELARAVGQAQAVQEAMTQRAADEVSQHTIEVADELARLDKTYDAAIATTAVATTTDTSAQLKETRRAAADLVSTAATLLSKQIADQATATATKIEVDASMLAKKLRAAELVKCYEVAIDAAASVAHRALFIAVL